MKRKTRIKQRWVVLIVVLLVIAAVLAGLYLWQQENLKAAANARKYTQQELREQLADSRGSVQETLEQHPEITVRDLNDEERKALRSGDLTPQELIAILTQPKNSAAGTDAQAPEETPAPETTPVPETPASQPVDAPTVPTPTPTPTEAPHEPTPEEIYQTKLSELVAQVYVMREQYTAQLDAMVAQAKAEYHAMPESERTKSKLLSWASGYAAKATELEHQCDAQMDSILAEMTALIKENGGDLSLIKTMAYSYAEEKRIQKSIYIQELEKRGIM